MLEVVSITLPIFALIGIGYGCTRAGLFGQSDIRMLGRFVLQVALPALLFNAVGGTPFSEVFDAAYLLVFGLGTLATLAAALIWFHFSGMESSRFGVATLGAAVPNSALVGYPIFLLAFPAVAGKILALNMIVENFLIIPISFALISLHDRRGAGSLPRLLAGILGDILRRPMVIGLLIGMAVSVTQVPVPAAICRLAALLAGASAPVALFYIGGVLAGASLKGNRAIAAQIVVAKLVIHPALTLAALTGLTATGLVAPDPAFRAPLFVSAALPMFATFTLVAQEKGHEGMASIAMLAATCISFVTISALLLVFG